MSKDCPEACTALYINKRQIIKIKTYMKDLGIILVLLGVLCLVIYALALPANWLLVISLVLEVAGILGYIFLNRMSNK